MGNQAMEMVLKNVIVTTSAWLVCCGIVAGQDRVFPISGVRASGTIKSLSPTQVVIEVRGKAQTYQLSEVRKVAFDDEPKSLDRARDLIDQKQYEQAIDELRKIAMGDISNPVIRQEVEYYRSYAQGKLGLAGKGDKNKAITGLLGIARANSKTHHLYDLSELLGELALAVGQPDQALRYFGILGKATDPMVKARAAYRLGEVHLSKQDIAEAEKMFRGVKSSDSSTPALVQLQRLADVGLAAIDIAKGDSNKALKSLNSLASKNDSTDHLLFAKINNTRGACYKKLSKPKQALCFYLATDLMFFTNPELHAEALYNLTQLWPEVGDSARAAEARERLVNQYASSPWAKKL